MRRYCCRFWGTLDAVQGLLMDYYPNDPFLNKISKWQAFSMLLYHPLEHYTWVGYTAPGSLPAGRVNGVMRVTCQLWVVWILLEFVALRHKWRKAQASDLGEQDKAQALSDIKWRAAQMAGDLLLGLHWGLKGGIGLNEPTIGVLGLFGALVGGWQKWKAMG